MQWKSEMFARRLATSRPPSASIGLIDGQDASPTISLMMAMTLALIADDQPPSGRGSGSQPVKSH
jgi:hypothetical protein